MDSSPENMTLLNLRPIRCHKIKSILLFWYRIDFYFFGIGVIWDGRITSDQTNRRKLYTTYTEMVYRVGKSNVCKCNVTIKNAI